MNSNVKSRIEFGLNVIVVVAIVVVATLTVLRYQSAASDRRIEGPNTDQRAQALIGQRLTIPGFEWRRNQKSLVFFLQQDCPACKVAGPFYRQLIDEAAKRNATWVAILPDPLDQAAQYVRSLDFPGDHVRTDDPAKYEVTATPTAMVVNGEGVVQGAWIGSAPNLEEKMRSEVVALLEANDF